MTIQNSVLNQLRTYLKADSNLNSVRTFTLGIAAKYRKDQYPVVELIIFDRDRAKGYLGASAVYAYLGEIRVYNQYADVYEVTNREMDVPSYIDTDTQITHVINLLDSATKETLDALSGVGFTVEVFTIGKLEMGITVRDEVQNTFDNYASLAFRCEVLEDRP